MSLEPPPPASDGNTQHPASSAGVHCPLGLDWHRWDVLNAGARLAVLPRRESLPASATDGYALPIEWGAPSEHRAGNRAARHLHGNITVEGVRLHVDWVVMDATGPGRSLVETRLFVDGELRAYAAEGGCSLGSGTACYFPAVARIAPGIAVAVERDANRRPHARLVLIGA